MKLLIVAPSLRNTSPGSRFRLEQWMKYWERDGVQCDYAGFEDEELHRVIYARGRYAAKGWHMMRAFLRRFALLPGIRRYDAVVMYEEASRIGPAIIERLIVMRGVPLVYDFCDPIYLSYKSQHNSFFSYLKFVGKAATICRVASHVLVGNPDLERYARQFNQNVSIVPITIDTQEYQPRSWPPPPPDYVPVVGWSGSHSTVVHLSTLKQTLGELRKSRNFRLDVLGTPEYSIDGVDVRARNWTPELEVPFLQACDIGIMPLPGDEWTRLRSHLKVRQYMGIGVPCVASPVGVITELIQDGVNGFLASTHEEWIEKLSRLIDSPDLRRQMGERARKTIEDGYSGELWAERVLKIIRSVAGQRASRSVAR